MLCCCRPFSSTGIQPFPQRRSRSFPHTATTSQECSSRCASLRYKTAQLQKMKHCTRACLSTIVPLTEQHIICIHCFMQKQAFTDPTIWHCNALEAPVSWITRSLLLILALGITVLRYICALTQIDEESFCKVLTHQDLVLTHQDITAAGIRG